MKNNLYYILMILISLQLASLNAMVANRVPVTLYEPELWASDGITQLKGGPIPAYFPKKYIETFPQLKNYLSKNENRLPGFDKRMFFVMNGCLKCAHFYKKVLKENNEIFLKAKMNAWFEKCSEKDLVDILDISEVAGLPSFIVQWSRNELAKRNVRITDVYPDYFDFKEEVEWDYLLTDEKEEWEEQEARQNSTYFKKAESEQEHLPLPLKTRFSQFITWIKSFFTAQPTTYLSVPNLSFEQLRAITLNFKERQNMFYHSIKHAQEAKIKKLEKEKSEQKQIASQTWSGKLRSWMAYLFWK